MRLQNRKFIRIGLDVDVPLMGCVAFGVIDRGTNIIQVRPSSYCILNCIFCSTDAGPQSKHRLAEYCVWYPEDIAAWVIELAKFKGGRNIEAHIDTVGDPLLYHSLVELVSILRDSGVIDVISLQTHGPTLTYRLVDELEEAGLDRINLSIDSLTPRKATFLQGAQWFNVRKVVEVAEYIASSSKIDLLLAPIHVPGLNDRDIEEIIRWGLSIGVGKKWMGFGIQKYVPHKHGRKPRGVRSWSWRKFYRWLRELEERHNVKLICRKEDFGIHSLPSAPKVYRVGEKVKVRVVCDGWLKGEKIGVPLDGKRVITIIGASEIPLESKITVRIISNKDNIYLARPLTY